HRLTDEVKTSLVEKYFPAGAETTPEGHTKADFNKAFYHLEHEVVRELTLEGKRLDGRTKDALRDVSCRVEVLPQVHGSALFTRGETQSLASVTLGTSRDQQRSDGLFGESSQRFML